MWIMCICGVYMCSVCVQCVCVCVYVYHVYGVCMPACAYVPACGDGSWISTSQLMVEPALSCVSLALGVQTLEEKMFLQAKSEQRWVQGMKGTEDWLWGLTSNIQGMEDGNSYVMKTPRPTLIMPFSILNVIFVSNLALKFSEIS